MPLGTGFACRVLRCGVFCRVRRCEVSGWRVVGHGDGSLAPDSVFQLCPQVSLLCMGRPAGSWALGGSEAPPRAAPPFPAIPTRVPLAGGRPVPRGLQGSQPALSATRSLWHCEATLRLLQGVESLCDAPHPAVTIPRDAAACQRRQATSCQFARSYEPKGAAPRNRAWRQVLVRQHVPAVPLPAKAALTPFHQPGTSRERFSSPSHGFVARF